MRIEEKAENSGVRGKAWCIADRAWGHSWNIGMVEWWAESIGKRVGGWRSASLEVGGKSRTTRGDGETETRRER